jgi:hypothetical protein
MIMLASAPMRQTLAVQQAELTAAGCTTIFAEKTSAARSDRPQPAKLLKALKPATW